MSSVQDVLAVLEDSGYRSLPKPLTVVGTEFDFEAAARGVETSHDLVLVASEEIAPRRLTRLVAGLARSLDLAASRRPVSLVVVGTLAPSFRAQLERYARVLVISVGNPTTTEIKESIAVLLPLDLPNATLVHESNFEDDLLGVIGAKKTTSEHLALIATAGDGERSVREALRFFANEGVGWDDEEIDHG